LAAARLCVTLLETMYDFPLTGAQKSHLRGLGQKLDAHLKVGKGGLTPEFFAELQKLLRAHELVKLRFLSSDRDERATLCEKIADEGRCVCIGAVGHTALFYRQHPEPKARTVVLPETKSTSTSPAKSGTSAQT
jgi:RNA-binding protein